MSYVSSSITKYLKLVPVIFLISFDVDTGWRVVDTSSSILL